jgi:anaerobic ribonucleoside-triphosphate reductase activating protein
MIENENLRNHSRIKASYVNGPGRRAVIWVQGCSGNCPGCCNPELKDPLKGRIVGINALFYWLAAIENIAGVSISGGEPVEQIFPLACFLEQVKTHTPLSVLVFSGKTRSFIEKLPDGQRLLDNADVLIDGPYDPARANPPGMWPSSSNQNIRLLTNRYTAADFTDIPECEIIIAPDGAIMSSGLRVMGGS